MPTYSIPDDGTMEAALYGSAHIETILARENGEKLRRVFDERIADTMATMDLELAEVILTEAPFIIESDEPLDPQQWPADILSTVYSLRYMERQILGKRLVESWVDDADHRGRLIGLGEHSVRTTLSGDADRDYKMSVLRGGLP